MTSSTRASLIISFSIDPTARGYSSLAIMLSTEGPMEDQPVFRWSRDNGLLGRRELIDHVVEAVREHKPAAVKFKSFSTDGDPFHHWSPQTVRDIISGQCSTDDLLIT